VHTQRTSGPGARPLDCYRWPLMANKKSPRQRDAARAREAREAALRARKRKAERRKLGIVVFTAVLLVLGISAFVVTDGPGTDVESTGTIPTGTPVSLSPVPPGATVQGSTPCPPTDGTALRTTVFSQAPPMCIDPSKRYSAEVTTSKGRLTIELDPRAAPVTVNSFVVLARYKYFDGIPFHRIIPGFVVQGGDQTATGRGGPGYQFEDELPAAGAYEVGSVAMANSSAPGTNGSQFFIVTGPAGVTLPPQYSLFGKVSEGMETVRAIEEAGTPGGQPTQVVTITSVTIKES
jgi:cyclophilin family peptidyl-prolyl cis-trans isomerase